MRQTPALLSLKIGECAFVLRKDRQNHIRLLNDGAVVDQIHSRNNHCQQSKQSRHCKHNEFELQLPNHTSSSKEYPAFREDLMVISACRAASFLRR